MSAVNFAKEFTQAIARWTKPVPPNGENGETFVPLTSRQVVKAIQDVVQVMLGVNLQVSDYSSVRTPASGIAICTPSAPMVPKVNLDLSNGCLGRFRSLDTLTALSQSNNANLPEPESLSKSQEDMDVVENTKFEDSAEEKKLISRSSPAIHVSNVRSDTFIREEEEKNAARNAGKQEENVPSKKESIGQSFVQKMEDLRYCALEVISKIDDVKQDLHPRSKKHIRRLSSISVLPGLSRSSSLMRQVPPPKIRRSSAGIPGTPTSSKLNTTITAEKDSGSARRKTIGGASLQVKSSKISPTNAMPAIMKKSPLSSGGRPAKNPKYAHVQSTIPKAVVGKRKAP